MRLAQLTPRHQIALVLFKIRTVLTFDKDARLRLAIAGALELVQFARFINPCHLNNPVVNVSSVVSSK